MSLFKSLSIAGVVLCTGATAAAQDDAAQPWPACGVVDTYPGAAWPDPDPHDWDLSVLTEARRLFEASEAHAVMVVHRGRPIAVWGEVDDPLTIQSMRKPIVGAMIGQLIDEGALALDDTLAELNIQDSDPPLTDAEREATVEDLLRARSGVLHDSNYEVGGWRRLRERLREAGGIPRGRWFYNNWDFNVLGTITEQAGQAGLGQMMSERIAGPLDMEDYDPERVSYSGRDSLTQRMFGYGSDHRAYMFDMSTRDMARFALLYLGCGRWGEDQVVPERWVRASMNGVDTRAGLPANMRTGFDQWGYVWWVENSGTAPRFPQLAHAQPYFGGSGYRGHFMLVMPRFDLVIVHQPKTTGGIGDLAQMSRATFGTPNVEAQAFAALVNTILEAHPGE